MGWDGRSKPFNAGHVLARTDLSLPFWESISAMEKVAMLTFVPVSVETVGP